MGSINHYRYYTKEQLPVLDIIKSARSLDISPKSLVPLINSKSTPLVFSELKNQKTMLQEQVKNFEFMINQIEAIEASYKDSASSIKEKGVYEKQIRRRFIINAEVPEPLTIDTIDACYNEIEKSISENNYINFYQYGLLLKNHGKGIYPVKAFIVVNHFNKDHRDKGMNNIDIIEGGRCICTNYTTKNGAKKQKALTRYLDKNNLIPKRLIQVELVSDFFNVNETIFELQVFVE